MYGISKFSRLMSMCFLIAALTGCYTSPKQIVGRETADRMAGPAFMLRRQIEAGKFVYPTYERVHNRGGIVHLYIEGDDPNIVFDGMSSDLIGMQLASRDKAKNVVYLPRPCQFKPTNGSFSSYSKVPVEACDLKYLGKDRFAPEVIESYHAALDNIKKRWGFSGFRIYGHSGGGVIGALLAYERQDILSLVTVSAMLDHHYYTELAQQTYEGWKSYEHMSGSLNAADIAIHLQDLPQAHYYGLNNSEVPVQSLFIYLDKMGPTNCVQYEVIQENGFKRGWVDKWPDLLKDKPVCTGPRRDILREDHIVPPISPIFKPDL